MAETSAEASVEVARPLRVVDERLFGSQVRGEPEKVAGLEEIIREGAGELRFDPVADRAFAVIHDPERGDERDPDESRYTFRLIPLSEHRTRVDLRVEHDAGLLERAQEALGTLQRRVSSELTRFAEHVEATTDPPT